MDQITKDRILDMVWVGGVLSCGVSLFSGVKVVPGLVFAVVWGIGQFVYEYSVRK